MTVRLPWPPSQLRPNIARTKHWRSNGTAAALYKSLVAVDLKAQGVGKVSASRVALDITFHPPSKRRMDLDGSLSAAKAGLDQLAYALGIDDHCFDPITVRHGDVVKGGAVVVSIVEVWP